MRGILWFFAGLIFAGFFLSSQDVSASAVPPKIDSLFLKVFRNDLFQRVHNRHHHRRHHHHQHEHDRYGQRYYEDGDSDYHSGFCSRLERYCARRWGWRTVRYHRCLRWYRCWLGRVTERCEVWRHRCADWWGWRTRKWYQCLRPLLC